MICDRRGKITPFVEYANEKKVLSQVRAYGPAGNAEGLFCFGLKMRAFNET
jgi:hypothetical protein